jgi:hypothetical protein
MVHNMKVSTLVFLLMTLNIVALFTQSHQSQSGISRNSPFIVSLFLSSSKGEVSDEFVAGMIGFSFVVSLFYKFGCLIVCEPPGFELDKIMS